MNAGSTRRARVVERGASSERRRVAPSASSSRYAWRAALVYALLGTAWILFSDLAVEVAVPDRWEQLAQSLKGTAFILGSSLFIFLTIRSHGRDRARALQAEHQSRDHARQQAAVAELGQLALTVGGDLDTLFEAATREVARTLEVAYGKVLELLPDGRGLRLRSGTGWHPDLVGNTIVPADAGSQAGYTLRSRGPVIVEDLRTETRFSGPSLLTEHRVVSGISTLIGKAEAPWGVLGAHSTELRRFSADDVSFLKAVANVLAGAIQRVRAETALRQTEERFRLLVERTPGIVYIAEPGATGTWYYVSPQVEELLGYPPSYWIEGSHLWFEHVHEEDRARVAEAEERSGEIGERFVDEYRMIAADGAMRWVRDEAEVIRPDEGSPILWGILYDVTEAKASEQALLDAEERYRNLVERTPAVVYMAEPGPEGAFTYVSPQVEALVGYPSSHWTADPLRWFDDIHEDDRAQVAAAEERIREIGDRFAHEYRMTTASGRTIWVRDEAQVVRRDEGRPILWGIMHDITESKQAEVEIRRFAARLEALHDLDRAMLSAASTDELLGVALDRLRQLVPCDRAAVRLFDEERGVLRVAQAWQREGIDLRVPDEVPISDPKSRALLQQELFLVRDMESLPEIPPALRPLAEARVRSGVGAALTAEGRSLGYLLVMSLTPQRFDEHDGEIVREFASEVAIAIRQAGLREALRERAQQLQELADQRQVLLGQVVAAQEQERRRVARELHDGLGQTLTAISLRTGALEMRATPETKVDAVKLRELTTSALAESRRIVWGLRPADLDTLGFVEVLRRTAADLASSSGVGIEVRFGEEGVGLSSEEESIVLRILQEALNNAIRHAGATSIRVDVGVDAHAFVATVADDGGGFDPAETNWGVGLISMRERAELLGGRLEVHPRPEGGTLVRLRLAEGRAVGIPGGDG